MSSTSDNEDCSQETTSATDLARLVEQMRADSKRRKEAKRRAIETEYAQKIDQIRAKAHAIHDAHKAKVAKANQAHHARLASLLHSRQIEEMAIWASLRRLEAARCALADLLAKMYSQRLEVMAEIGTTGKLPSEVEGQEDMEREMGE